MGTISNLEIAQVLYEIGEYLEMQGVAFKPRAYEKVAQTIESLEEPVVEIYRKGGLKAVEDIPGVGISIAEKIEELIKTGHLQYYEDLKKKTPVDLSALTKVEGLGPKKIKVLYQKLGIKNLADLEKAARAGKIGKLEGFGPKSEENILKGLEFAKKNGGRFLLGSIYWGIKIIEERLAALPGVKKAQVVGSIRRQKETVGDGDILVISDRPEAVMDYFVSMPEVARVIAKGDTKSAVTLKNGMDVDVRVVPAESYGSALSYFTGSKDHNVFLRQLAIKKGLKLSEYGLFLGEKQIAGKTEEEIYKALGMDYIEPEMREMTGEIEVAQKRQLPKLINYGDLKGDLQVQTSWTDGEHSIEAMAVAAAKAGLEYIAITDHTKRLAMTHGLDEWRIVQQMKEIDQVNLKLKTKNLKLVVLKGTECDILKDGSLDLPDEILKQLDIVGVSVHSLFNLPQAEQTARIQKAMRNPNVDILFHPTGRLIQKRAPYEVDMEQIIKTAKETGTILEIDGSPDRLDLKDEYIRKCVAAGVKMSIDSDAHNSSHFAFLDFGIGQGRRGWATKGDIINAWPLEKMLKYLK
ncbi:MAG: DNA polymerase/3'-5' exonuclease PolX [bacterium]|nr:DNA polymerase/3'-5' exonuclease PolX [bacterium]